MNWVNSGQVLCIIDSYHIYLSFLNMRFSEGFAVLLHHLDHFCRSNDEWLDGEVLDISCYEVGVFFGKSHFVEYDVFRIWEIDAFS